MGDFKANLVLGCAEVSTDKEFFESPECSVFGVVVVYKQSNGKYELLDKVVFENANSFNTSLGEIAYETYCFLLKALTHDANAAIYCFNQTMEHDRFRNHHFTSIDVWVDNGTIRDCCRDLPFFWLMMCFFFPL